MADTVHMKYQTKQVGPDTYLETRVVEFRDLLPIAREAAWEQESQSLGGRWVSAFKATYRGFSKTRIGWLVFPHTIEFVEII